MELLVLVNTEFLLFFILVLVIFTVMLFIFSSEIWSYFISFSQLYFSHRLLRKLITCCKSFVDVIHYYNLGPLLILSFDKSFIVTMFPFVFVSFGIVMLICLSIGPLLRRACGYYRPPVTNTSDSMAYVRFTSNGPNNQPGFKLKFTASVEGDSTFITYHFVSQFLHLILMACVLSCSVYSQVYSWQFYDLMFVIIWFSVIAILK